MKERTKGNASTDGRDPLPARATTKRAHSRKRLPRGTLSRELIVAAALRIADSSGVEQLTFQALGRELKAHPTAIYRHFRNKDDLILSLVDALHAEALENLPPPSEDWSEDLMQIALRTHDAFLRHPRVGAMAAPRTARLDNEFRSVDRKIDCMRRAGLNEHDAARYYRVYADLVLCYSAMDASRALLDPDVRAGDDLSWQVEYRSQPRDRYPNIAFLAPYFCDLDDPENFKLAVRSIIDAVRCRAAQT